MVKISRFLRPPLIHPIQPTEEDLQRMVYDLVREQLLRTIGPGGSFSVTINPGAVDDAFFAQTFAETIAWDVAARVDTRAVATARLIA